MNNVLKPIQEGGIRYALLLLFVLSFAFSSFLFVDIGFYTLRVTHILLALLAGICALSFLIHKPYFSFSHLLLMFFFLSCTLSFFFSPNLSRTFFIFAITLLTASLYFIFPSILSSKQKLSFFIQILLILSFFLCAFGLFQFIGDLIGLPASLTGLRSQYQKEILGFPRIQSTFHEPLYFANFLLIPLGIVCSFLFGYRKDMSSDMPLAQLTKSKKIPALFLYTLLFFILLTLFLTSSRAAFISVITMMILFGMVYRNTLWNIKRLLMLFFLFLFCFFAGLWLLNWYNVTLVDKTPIFLSHVTRLFDGASFEERFITFSQAFQIFLAYPLFGIGFGSFGPYTSVYTDMLPTHGWPIVNNLFLELLAETGIIGCILFSSFLIVLFLEGYNRIRFCKDVYMKNLLIGLLIATMGVLIQYQTFSTLYIAHIWLLFGLLIAVIHLCKRV